MTITKTFYIANDDFNKVGHSIHTLRSLCYQNYAPVILLTHPQGTKFAEEFAGNCSVVECLPTTDEARQVSPATLGACIARQILQANIEDGDLVVLKMPLPHLLLSLVYALALSALSQKNWRLVVLISQSDEGYAWEEIKYSDCFNCISQLPQSVRERIAILHEREVLRQHWLKLFPKLRMGLCGYVTEWFKTEIDQPLSCKAGTQGFQLAYLGEARSEKGFHRLAELIGAKVITASVLAHSDANPNNMTDEYHEAIRIMESCQKEGAAINLAHQRRDNSYYSAFCSSNVALMLYSPEYRLRGSGVLQECAAVGMRVIAYEDLGFHLDYPANVLTVSRDVDAHELARQVQACMDRIERAEHTPPLPSIITAKDFRAALLSNLPETVRAQRTTDEHVFVVTNNVHKQGCSKIIEAQQQEICSRGLTPVFISFEWPDIAIEWTDFKAFQRIWRMQMNASSASYGRHYLTIPLVTRNNVLQRYNHFHYKNMVSIASDVDSTILDTYLSWRKNPTVVMNYLHHAPILEGRINDLDRVFLEIHDIISVQQSIRINDDDHERFEENLAAEIIDLNRFKHKYSLSANEVKILAEKGCDIKEHSYLDYLIRHAGEEVTSRKDLPDSSLFDNDYLCIVGSDHPSNVSGINRFCDHELQNTARTIPIVICGLVSDKITAPAQALKQANIHLLGFVPSVAAIIEYALLTLNPVDIGSGSPIKVLESIAHRTPCLATHRTIVAMPPHPLVIAYDFEGRLLVDKDIRHLAEMARKSALNTASPDYVVTNRLGAFLDEYHSA